MAYLAEIQLAVKGARQLKELSDAIESTSKRVDRLARDIQTLSEGGIPKTINNLRNLVQSAADAFNEAALGTDEATAAAKNYVKVTGELNAGLRERSALLDKITRQERAAAIVRAGIGMPAQQLLLAAAAPGAPAMGGGARRRITGPVERLGGARTADEAAMALRFAQALQQQVKPLSQIDALYAGIAGEASKLQKIKALPSTEMLNATARGLQTIESIENRRFTTAQRRAQKLQQIQDYYGDTGMANAGYGAQGPAVPPTGIRRRTGIGAGAGFGNRAGGAISSAIIGGGFPLLFGQGPAAAVGGALGGAAGGILGGGFGFALSIAGTAIGDLITQSETLNKTLATLNSSLSATGSSSITTAADIKQLAKDLSITNDEAVQLIGTFSQFGDAKTREALASLFGGVGGAATFEAIARAGIDEKNALSSIFELRKVIGNEAATQLALQLDTVGATQTQAALLKLVVERSIQSSVAAAKNVQFTDNLLSTWENIVAGIAGALSLAIQFIQKMREGSLLRLPFLDQIASLLGGVKARTGKQIAEERGSAVEKRLRAEIKAVMDAVKKETGVLGTQNALQGRMAGSDKAARDAARLAEQRQEQLRSAQILVSKKQAELKLSGAISEEDKLKSKYEATRTERMQNYVQLLRKSLSDSERISLIEAQNLDIQISKLEYEKELNAVRKQQVQNIYAALDASNLLNLNFERMALFAGAGKTPLAFNPNLNLVPGITDGELGAQAEIVRLELEKLIAPVEQLKTAAEGIGTAFGDSFKAAASGAMTAQEALSSFFQSVADRFLDMAAQIIAKWIEMTILNTALNLFPGGGLFKGAGPVSGVAAFSGAGMGSKGFFLPDIIRPRAAGGPVSAGSPYMVGERGPELFVPGRSGTIVPNNALSAGGTTSVVVNVDAGASNVQGNDAQASQLGKVIGLAVQQELIKQKRPGGLLS